MFTKGSESAKALTKVLTNQSDAAPEDMESGLDVIVLPNHRNFNILQIVIKVNFQTIGKYSDCDNLFLIRKGYRVSQ